MAEVPDRADGPCRAGRDAHLVSPAGLASRLGEPGLRILDASWYLPVQGRDARAEYLGARVPGAAFFDIDAIAETDSGLPHTLASERRFAAMVGALGVASGDGIVVYDGMGLFSAPRVWWNLRLMGARDVRVLDGGLPAWREAGLPLESGPPATPAPARFDARLDPGSAAGGVTDLDAVRAHLAAGDALVVDVRPPGRFAGEEPEPRAGTRSGHMPGAVNLPFQALADGGRLRPDDELRALFEGVGARPGTPVVTSCGSGVTAAVANLALAVLGRADVSLYDGSWSEWGGRTDVEVVVGT